jgi:transposase
LRDSLVFSNKENAMDKRMYPATPEFFRQTILPLIEGSYIWKGRPPRISHYQVFCAILYVLRVGCPWRDLPSCYGNWHSIYLRFKRGGERGLWWRILITLQQRKQAQIMACASWKKRRIRSCRPRQVNFIHWF